MPYGNLYKTEQSSGDEQKFRNVTNVAQQTTINIMVILDGKQSLCIWK